MPFYSELQNDGSLVNAHHQRRLSGPSLPSGLEDSKGREAFVTSSPLNHSCQLCFSGRCGYYTTTKHIPTKSCQTAGLLLSAAAANRRHSACCCTFAACNQSLTTKENKQTTPATVEGGITRLWRLSSYSNSSSNSSSKSNLMPSTAAAAGKAAAVPRRRQSSFIELVSNRLDSSSFSSCLGRNASSPEEHNSSKAADGSCMTAASSSGSATASGNRLLASSSMHQLYISGLNTSSTDVRGEGSVRSGHQEIQTLYAANNVTYPVDSISINLVNAPDNSTVQCDCGHINCPLCNLMMNLELSNVGM